ncbi:MAG: hypothetical protein APF84_16370 [Gracilibacter sp. BRH_c7a]|nr:MAG: hypothetical protein APF84_16370 [Gracilibacter sp. BRH_c7a]
MHSGFYLFFWGLLLQYNIVIKGFDILPDFIGYILIYKGLNALAAQNKYFAIASKITLPLILLSLVNFYNFQYHQDLLISLVSTLDTLKTIVFALNMYLVYNLCRGTIVVAEDIDDYLETTIRQRLYVFLGVAAVFLILSVVSLFPFTDVSPTMQALFVLAYLTYLVALLLVASGMYKMHKELSPKKAGQLKENKKLVSNRKR